MLSACACIVSIIGFVVHYELVFHKVETVRLCFVRMIYQLLHCTKSNVYECALIRVGLSSWYGVVKHSNGVIGKGSSK